MKTVHMYLSPGIEGLATKKESEEEKMELSELISKNLAGYTIERFTDVFKTDDDGRKTKSLGYFRNNELAKAFAENQADAAWHKTSDHLVLTNGKEGFLLGDSIIINEDEQAELEVRQKALSKLSAAERKVLGL